MRNPLFGALLMQPQRGNISITFSSASGLDPVVTGGTSIVWTGPSGQTSTGGTPSPALAEAGKWEVSMDDQSAVTQFVADNDYVTEFMPSISNTAVTNFEFQNNAGFDVDDFVDQIYALRNRLSAMDVDISGTCPDVSDLSSRRIAELEANFSHNWTYNKTDWTPSQITTQTWMDGNDSGTVQVTASAVSQWDDKSANSYVYDQSTASKKPSYASSTLTFDGNDSLNEGATSTFRNVSEAMVFTVFKPTNTTGPFCPWAWDKNTSGITRLRMNVSSGFYNIGGRRLDSNSFQSVTSSTAATTNTVLHGSIIDASNAQIAHAINGTLESFSSWQSSGSFSDTDSAASSIGENTNALTPFNGDLNEIIVVHGDISTVTRQLIEGYLAHKWDGILGGSTLVTALPSDHPYKLVAPVV